MSISSGQELVFRAKKWIRILFWIAIAVALEAAISDFVPGLNVKGKSFDFLKVLEEFFVYLFFIVLLPGYLSFTTYSFDSEKIAWKVYGFTLFNCAFKRITFITNSIAPNTEYALYGPGLGSGIPIPKYMENYDVLTRELLIRIQVANPNVQINEEFRKKFNIP